MKNRAYFFKTNLFFALLGIFSTPIAHAQSTISVNNEAEINTAFQEYSPAFYKNGLVFIGSNPAVEKDKKTDDETGKKATSFFLATREDNGSLRKVVPFAEELTTKYYDGPLSFNTDGTVVYFTRSNLRRGKAVRSKDGLVKLKVFTAQKAETGWTNILELPLNLPDYDCAHPSISHDGKRLYFSSNRPDGFGGMDLYFCTFLNGKWSIPVNCGPKINTPKNEIFPFIHADGTLFFTSNGREGLGNLDIFYTMRTDTGWLMPKALPEPMNSSSDDFGLIVSPDKKSGYFSSNRASGKGDDDVYSFLAPNNVTEIIVAAAQTENQVQETEAPTPTPTTPMIAATELAPIKRTENTEGGNNLPKIQVKPTPIIENQADKKDKPIETPAIVDKMEKIEPTPTIEKEAGKVDKSDIPAETASIIEKPVIEKPTIEATENKPKPNATKIETAANLNKKPADIAANTKKQKPNNPPKKTDKKPIKPTNVQKQDSVAVAEIAPVRLAPVEVFAELPLLSLNPIVSIETPKMVDFASILPVFNKKMDKIVKMPTVVAENKPSVPPVEMPKQDLKPIEKPASEASRSETKLDEPTHQVVQRELVKDEAKEDIKIAKEEVKVEPKIESPSTETKPVVDNDMAAISPAPSPPTPVVSDNTTTLKEEIKVEIPKDSVIVNDTKLAIKEEIKLEKTLDAATTKITKSEVNGKVRKRYLVVVGTYSDHKNAADQQKKATSKGYSEVEIVQYPTNHLYGVCVMQSDDEKSAQAFAKDINKSKAMDAFVKVLK
jgi:WD40-like Beta Propeller Repeat/SPOR domain